MRILKKAAKTVLTAVGVIAIDNHDKRIKYRELMLEKNFAENSKET